MRLWLLVPIVFLLAACASSPPTRAPDITGEITRLTDVSGGLQLLVETVPSDTAGSAKASVRTDSSTRWFAGSATYDASQLRQGMRVSVWFDGPVAMSYPVQAKAADVLVLSQK